MLFFGVMILFLSYVYYDNLQEEETHIKEKLFLEMKNYSLGGEDEHFSSDVVSKEKERKYYRLYEDEKSLFILVPIIDVSEKETMVVSTPMGVMMIPYSSKRSEARKIWYPKSDYLQRVATVRQGLMWQFVLFGIGAMLIALLAAWYTLRPVRRSMRLLEDFIKDIIHDLNTPLTAISLNLQMIDSREEEIESIKTAAQTIEMLHQNLDAYLKEQVQPKEQFEVEEIVRQYVAFFTPLYDYLRWDIEMEPCRLYADKQAFSRVVYNLLSNACKYNTNDGTVTIRIQGSRLTIRNDSYGVKHPERVFERFYKESERGLGIGLHIVDKLCRTLRIEHRFYTEGTDVVVELSCGNIRL